MILVYVLLLLGYRFYLVQSGMKNRNGSDISDEYKKNSFNDCEYDGDNACR